MTEARKITIVLAAFRHMGASTPQLALECFRMVFDAYYRNEWFDIVQGEKA